MTLTVDASDEENALLAARPPGQFEIRPVLEYATGDGAFASAGDQTALGGAVVVGSASGQRYLVGPALLDGAAVESAFARQDAGGSWAVDVVFTEEGIAEFNDAAQRCYATAATCPPQPPADTSGAERGMLVLVLDGEVLVAPKITQPSFERDQIRISGGLDQRSAERQAAALDDAASAAGWTVN